MSFIHEDPEFEALLTIVADERGIARPLIEKDYWVAHALWALHQTGLEIWFKGGTFVRHYEDAAAIIEKRETLRPLEMDLRLLAEEMLNEKQIARHPVADDPAFALADPVRKKALADAHAAIAPMYWGKRRSLDEACEIIRS